MFCTKCGSEINQGNKFCVKCGAPVYAFEQEPQAAEQNAQENVQTQPPEQNVQAQPPVAFEKPPKRRRRVLLPVILILLILLVIGVAGVAGYAVIKTDDFDDVVAEFESMPITMPVLEHMKVNIPGFWKTHRAQRRIFRSGSSRSLPPKWTA